MCELQPWFLYCTSVSAPFGTGTVRRGSGSGLGRGLGPKGLFTVGPLRRVVDLVESLRMVADPLQHLGVSSSLSLSLSPQEVVLHLVSVVDHRSTKIDP